MDRTPTASPVLDLLSQWKDILQNWALNGSICCAAQIALRLDGEPPLLAKLTIWVVAIASAPIYTTCWPVGSARYDESHTVGLSPQHSTG